MKIEMIFTLMILACMNFAFAQNDSIIVGEYDSTMTFYDIDPDTTILCEEHPGETKFYDIDLNQDGIFDFKLENRQNNGLGGGSGSIKIIPYNNNEIAFYRIDTAFAYDSSYVFRKVARPFEFGELIDNSSEFSDSIVFVSAYFWTGSPSFTHFSISDWIYLENQYTGIRMNINDTLVYGWIKLNNPNHSTITFEEYALSKTFSLNKVKYHNNVRIDFYPNPVSDFLYIIAPNEMTISNIAIVDLKGKTQFQKYIEESGLLKININNLQKGIYILKIMVNNETFSYKLLKK